MAVQLIKFCFYSVGLLGQTVPQKICGKYRISDLSVTAVPGEIQDGSAHLTVWRCSARLEESSVEQSTFTGCPKDRIKADAFTGCPKDRSKADGRK